MNVRRKKVFKRLLVLLIVGAAGIQFASPSLKNPPVQPGHDLMAANPPPPEVTSLLHAACYDCHSYETRWPWYAHVAPVSLWIFGHMRDGRDALNFSEWPRTNWEEATEKLDEIVRQVQHHKMPLPSYTWIHTDARLSDEQRGRILKWAEQEAQRLADEGN